MHFKKHRYVSVKNITVLKLKLFFCISLFFLLVFNLSARADELGSSRTFFVDSAYDRNSREAVQAVLKKVGASAYFYIESDYYKNLTDSGKQLFDLNINTLAENFDGQIYPKMRETFGYEWNPGIDGDGKITILLTDIKDTIGGAFNPRDEYGKEDIINGKTNDKSNEREMIYLNAGYLNEERIKSFLAHEFQHMITWYHKEKLKKISDSVWLNEARSEYASTAIGYDDDYDSSNLKARTRNFIIDPTDSLLDWQNKIYDYASANLFSQYLADHYRKNLFKAMIENDAVGTASIGKALQGLNYNASFRDIFTDWIVANYLNDTAFLAGNKYGYTNPNLTYKNFHLNPTSSYTMNDPHAVISLETSLKDWSGRYYEFKSIDGIYGKNNILQASVNGDNNGKFNVSYALFYNNGRKEIGQMNLDSMQDANLYVSDFGGDISSIVIMPSSQKEESNSAEVNDYKFSISVKMTDSQSMKKYQDNSLLRADTEEKVYVIQGGKKRWITTAAAFVLNGYKWENVKVIAPVELNAFENGIDIEAPVLKPDGTLLKGFGPKVYLIQNGKKRWITTAETFLSEEYKWEDIIQVSDLEMSIYPNGEIIEAPVLKPDGTLLKGFDPKVYLIQNGKKRWITSAKVFASRGYKWGNIIQVADRELNLYLNGVDIR